MPPPPMNAEEQKVYDEARRIITDAVRRMRVGKSVTYLGSAMAGGGLTALPPEIGQFSTLTFLDLSNNKLTALPPEIGKLTALTSLHLGDNQLTSLPPEIGHLSALSGLHLGRNPLTTLSPQIGHLSALNVLSLGNNQLRALPPEIGQLTALTHLYLDSNKLTVLPPEIGQISALISLNLSGNQLTALPPELSKLTKLEALYLHENPALNLPAEILGPTWAEVNGGAIRASPRAILDYYFNLQRAAVHGGARPLNEAKVLFLGQPEAGKSSLIHALKQGWPTPHFPQTDGIARVAWRVPVKEGRAVVKMTKGAEELRLNLWDFGGQEIYKATHTYFLTKRAVYVIVTTARKDADPDLEEWLETAKTFGGGAPVWVVINKHDENPNGGPDEVALMRKYYPMLRGFIRTQCQHAKKGPEQGKGAGKGIEELRDQLVAEAWAMTEVRQLMTTAALAIKERLESMKEPTLSLTQYRELCAELDEPSEGQQDTLLDLWDKLGTVRYFPEDEQAAPEFRDTAILNPDWVTEAVYRVLEDGKLKQTHGLVTAQDLDRITRALKHPAGSFRLIEEVMRRFSQLYDTQDGRMFVPHLLEDRESPVEWPAGALRFVYRYPVLPAGLMPAFIARMHNYHDETVSPWRKGCVLSVQGCRVRVIGDRKARTVEIEVAGEMAGRRRDALDHIRYAFEDMHRVFAGAQVVEELMPVPDHPDAPMLNYQGLRTLERMGVINHPFPADAAQSNFVVVNIPQALGGVRTPAREERERGQDPAAMPPEPQPEEGRGHAASAGAHQHPRRFKVALSFPGTRRQFVRDVAERLELVLGNDAVFYDAWFNDELARPNIDLILGSVYYAEAELVVPFFCQGYADSGWCGLEWDHIRSLRLRKEGRVMIFRFDDVEIPGLLPVDGYVTIAEHPPAGVPAREITCTPHEVARRILNRLGHRPAGGNRA